MGTWTGTWHATSTPRSPPRRGRLSTRPPTPAPRPRTRPRSTPAPALALPMGACHTGKATTTQLTGALGLATPAFLTPAMRTQHHRSTVTDPTRTLSPTSHITFKPRNIDNVVLKNKIKCLILEYIIHTYLSGQKK